MGNCMRCGRKKGHGKAEEIWESKNRKLREQRDKMNDRGGHRNGQATSNGTAEPVEKVVHVTPLTEPLQEAKDEIHPQERKILRLLLPYIPKKEWSKLRLVNKTWCSVVDGEWSRMRTIHLSELLPNRNDEVKTRKLANHLSSQCKLSKSIICTPTRDRNGPFDLTDEEFWRRLSPRTNDLTMLKLENVMLPKYFFTVFLPKCNNLESIEIHEANDQLIDSTNGEYWTDADRQTLSKTLMNLEKLNNLELKINKNYLNQESSRIIESLPSSKGIKLLDPINESNHTPTGTRPGLEAVSVNFYNGPNARKPRVVESEQPLTPTLLKTLTYSTTLTSLAFDLNMDFLDPHENEHLLRRCFSGFEDLKQLRITISTNERNVYDTLQTLTLILTTIAQHSPKLTNLELIRLPDPMGFDRRLATDFTTAFVKLNDHTQLDNFHVCILAPKELFHVWSLPWPALTRLRTLTVTDCDLYSERARGIDLESMPSLIAFTLRTDSLDDDMLARLFAQPRPDLVEVTLEPGPRGIGKRGMCTVAVACQNLQHLSISYGRCGGSDFESICMDSRGWVSFFRAIPPSLQFITLIDIERGYMRDIVTPVASQCPNVTVRPIYRN